ARKLRNPDGTEPSLQERGPSARRWRRDALFKSTPHTSASVALAAWVAAAAEPFVEGVVVDEPAVAGEGVDELDGLGFLVGGDVGPAVLDDVLGRGLLAVLEDDDGFDALGPLPVGHADDGRFLDGWVLGDAGLDLGRVDVL